MGKQEDPHDEQRAQPMAIRAARRTARKAGHKPAARTIGSRQTARKHAAKKVASKAPRTTAAKKSAPRAGVKKFAAKKAASKARPKLRPRRAARMERDNDLAWDNEKKQEG